jgi:hypothetical protein
VIHFELSAFLSVVLGTIISNAAEHELIEAVRATLDTVNRAVSIVNEASGQHSAITWRTEGVLIELAVNRSHAGLEGASKEVSEGSVLRIPPCGFLNFDTVNHAK